MQWDGGADTWQDGGLTELRVEKEEELTPTQVKEEQKAQETAAVDR